MTGVEHEAEAERLLAGARGQRERRRIRQHALETGHTNLAPGRDVAPDAELIAEAQVHATLAVLAVVKAAGGDPD